MIQILDGRGILEDDIDMLEEENEALLAEVERLTAENKRLAREVDVLRIYGNNDCTRMADEALMRETPTEKRNSQHEDQSDE